MALQLELSGGSQPYAAAQIVLERALGREVRWQFTLDVAMPGRNQDD